MLNAAENIDWESSQSKYADILARYREHYPSPEQSHGNGKGVATQEGLNDKRYV